MKELSENIQNTIQELNFILEQTLNYCYKHLPKSIQWKPIAYGPFKIFIKRSKLIDKNYLKMASQNLQEPALLEKIKLIVSIFDEARKFQDNFETVLKTNLENSMDAVKKYAPYAMAGVNMATIGFMIGTLILGGSVGILPVILGLNSLQAYNMIKSQKGKVTQDYIKNKTLENYTQKWRQSELKKLNQYVNMLQY